MADEDVTGFIRKPLCPFCGAPWTDDMVKVESEVASAGCESGGWDTWAEGSIEITCSSCERLIYSKPFSSEE